MKMLQCVAGASILLGVAAVGKSAPISDTQAAKAQAKIQAGLQKDPDLKDNSIDVTIENGVVTLKGVVDTKAERARAERIAYANGVASLDDQLTVSSQNGAQAIIDSTVTAQVTGQFAADERLKRADIAVTTNNGVVKLKGTVASEEAHQHALEIARGSTGVKRVEDHLQVAAPKPMPLGTVPNP
jgi:hyperosmotically inducible protein